MFQHVTSSVPVIIWAKGTYANYIYICITLYMYILYIIFILMYISYIYIYLRANSNEMTELPGKELLPPQIHGDVKTNGSAAFLGRR